MKCTSATEYLHFYLILDFMTLRLDTIANLQIIFYALSYFVFFCTRRIVFSFETTATEEVQFAN